MSTTMNCHFEPVFCHVSDDRHGGFIPAPNRDYGAFEALFGRKQTKQDKGPASPVAVPSDFCPQCGQFRGRGAGVRTGKKNTSGVLVSCRAQIHRKTDGVKSPGRSKDE